MTVWNEYRRVENDASDRDVYPDGIHAVIADHLRWAGYEVETATLDEPEHGLSHDAVEETDVLVYWGHAAHDDVEDEIVERTKAYVLDGMGFLPLHSAHESKLFESLNGTTCSVN